MKSVYDNAIEILIKRFNSVKDISIPERFKGRDPLGMEKMTPTQSLESYMKLKPEVKDIMRQEPEWAEWEKKVLKMRGDGYGL